MKTHKDAWDSLCFSLKVMNSCQRNRLNHFEWDHMKSTFGISTSLALLFMKSSFRFFQRKLPRRHGRRTLPAFDLPEGLRLAAKSQRSNPKICFASTFVDCILNKCFVSSFIRFVVHLSWRPWKLNLSANLRFTFFEGARKLPAPGAGLRVLLRRAQSDCISAGNWSPERKTRWKRTETKTKA